MDRKEGLRITGLGPDADLESINKSCMDVAFDLYQDLSLRLPAK
ncbi:hypothetical protein [Desulfonatronospira sp.]|nr:hypothetical protein [Desulfonatronospira sp.]